MAKEKKIKVVEHYKAPNGKMVAVPKVRMNFGGLLCSIEKAVVSGLIVQGMPAERQVVVAAHENSWVKPGDTVAIDFNMFPYTTRPGKHDTKAIKEVTIPEQVIDNRKYMYITDRQVKWIEQ